MTFCPPPPKPPPRWQWRKRREWFRKKRERAEAIGDFSSFLMPVIHAGYPTNPIKELIPLQPMPQRTATMIPWRWLRKRPLWQRMLFMGKYKVIERSEVGA